jgi:superfamily I DNA/RNA helicase
MNATLTADLLAQMDEEGNAPYDPTPVQVFQPSPHQAAAFSFLESATGNLILRAGAGSGKTTTIVHMLSRCFGSTIFLAFNKAIAEELRSRGVNARTFHSLCFLPVTRARNARGCEPNKLRMLVDEHFDDTDVRLYGSFICKLVSLARQNGIGAGLSDDTEQNWVDIVEHHDLELESERAVFATAIDYARKLLRLSNDDQRVDFDDLLYLAVKDGISLQKFDFVFVDEAQDTNAIQRAILRKIMKPDSRLVAVGDPSQAIYGFRGADSDSMDIIKAEFSATELPLTVSYRCARNIVEFAQQFGTIDVAPNAKDGSITDLDDKWAAQDFKAGDLILCRVTRPLVAVAYKLLKARIPAYIMGREIGAGLVSLINKLNAKGINALVDRLTVYTNREVEKAIAKKQEQKAAAVQDKTDCILFLIESLQETDRTVPALIRIIEQLFADKANAVVLATIHKAKGLEARRVFWIDRGYKCFQAKQEWQQQQEVNLQYVAATRAKEELYLINFEQKEVAA